MSVVFLNSGVNEYATQQGMNIGSQRHVANISVDEVEKSTESLLPHQAGIVKSALPLSAHIVQRGCTV